VAIDWAWSILFPPNLVQLQMNRTLKVGRANFAAGEFVFREGDFGDQFYLIEQGRARIYLDEKAPPSALLNPATTLVNFLPPRPEASSNDTPQSKRRPR